MGFLDALIGPDSLRLGSSGPDVTKLQNLLNQKGLPVKVDGNFGPATAAAVITFQTANGLTPDSVVGAKTKAKLGW